MAPAGAASATASTPPRCASSPWTSWRRRATGSTAPSSRGARGSAVARPDRLADGEIARRLEGLPGWTLREGKLHREFSFPDFVQAFAFMSGAALRAEAMGHHPEWYNVYNRVVVDLMTHDAQGITALDFELAQHMQALAGAG